MAHKAFPIDRRDAIKQMAPYLSGQGGVVNVRYSGEACASNAFVEVLTSLYENSWNGNCYQAKAGLWRSIRLDRDNYKVQYLPEIRAEFVKKMSFSLPPTVCEQPLIRSDSFASNNRSLGDQHIETHIHAVNQQDLTSRSKRDAWIKSLCTELKEFLQCGHFMVILMHGHEDEQTEFWDGLWHRGLAELTADGLLLVRMVDTADAEAKPHPRAAQPDADITLVQCLIGEQIDHAIDDVAAFISRWRPNWVDGRARAAAEMHVRTNVDDMSVLHGKLLTGISWLTTPEDA